MNGRNITDADKNAFFSQLNEGNQWSKEAGALANYCSSNRYKRRVVLKCKIFRFKEKTIESGTKQGEKQNC